MGNKESNPDLESECKRFGGTLQGLWTRLMQLGNRLGRISRGAPNPLFLKPQLEKLQSELGDIGQSSIYGFSELVLKIVETEMSDDWAMRHIFDLILLVQRISGATTVFAQVIAGWYEKDGDVEKAQEVIELMEKMKKELDDAQQHIEEPSKTNLESDKAYR